MINSLKEMLLRHEGKSLKPYRCPAGKLTIGIGHNIDAKGLPQAINAYLSRKGAITESMCNELLAADISSAYADCIRLYPAFTTFSENRQAALCDFMFNVGPGTAATFKNTNRAINSYDWERAAQGLENSLWYVQVGDRAPEIVRMIRGTEQSLNNEEK
jgi:lysozyme